MARISIMEALARVLTASKDYTDEKSILLDEDDGTFGGFFEGAYPELNTVNKTPIGAVNEINSNVNSKQNIVDNMLETESKTVVGAINELKDELVINDEAIFEFNPDLLDSYLEYYETAYGLIYCKIANADAIPENISECVKSGYTLKLYDSAKNGVIELPAYIEYDDNYDVYFVNDDTYEYYQMFIFAPNGWNPSGASHSPGIWIKYQTGSYHGNVEYPISITINSPKSVKDELENKADLVNEHELISMLEEELGIRVEE